MKYEITVDAYGHWAICEENGGDVIADLMTKQNAEKICLLLNRKHLVDGNAWFTIKEFSVRIHATDEGVIVDVWNEGEEDGDVVASTYAFDKELQ